MVDNVRPIGSAKKRKKKVANVNETKFTQIKMHDLTVADALAFHAVTVLITTVIGVSVNAYMFALTSKLNKGGK